MAAAQPKQPKRTANLLNFNGKSAKQTKPFTSMKPCIKLPVESANRQRVIDEDLQNPSDSSDGLAHLHSVAGSNEHTTKNIAGGFMDMRDTVQPVQQTLFVGSVPHVQVPSKAGLSIHGLSERAGKILETETCTTAWYRFTVAELGAGLGRFA